jgi:hypothetical protein
MHYGCITREESNNMRMNTTVDCRDRRSTGRRAALTVESLEGRLVLSGAVPNITANIAAQVQPPVKPSLDSLVHLTNLTINSITMQSGQLVADATATLSVWGARSPKR